MRITLSIIPCDWNETQFNAERLRLEGAQGRNIRQVKVVSYIYDTSRKQRQK